MKKFVNFLCSRLFIGALLIAIQIFNLVIAILFFSKYFTYFYAFCTLLSVAAVFWVISKPDNPSYKLAWVIPILIFPVFGGLFYLMFGNVKLPKSEAKKLAELKRLSVEHLPQNTKLNEEIAQKDNSVFLQINYIEKIAGFPIFANTSSEYLNIGEVYFEALKRELKSAKRFIFLEYFIIEKGKMWDEVLEILIEKVAEGVEVRVVYDDIGCSLTLPNNYNKTLISYGIKCGIFNRFTALVSIWHNNRDHRKITVIDGHTAFTGGINLADEYINYIEKFGHWKDTGILMKGDAAWGFTVMFLNVWNSINGMEMDDYTFYRPIYSNGVVLPETDGYVLPYGTDPIDKEILGENVYLNMITRSKKSVYIFTPYLVVDNETVMALCLAAKSGVDVRIITPFHEDKWYVHMMTRSFYQQLISAGVKIFEYTPGFIHAKSIVCDGELGAVGTINFDYRSLYFHFECAALIYKTKSVKALLEDFNKTEALSKRITLEECKKVKWYVRFMRSIMRLFAPLI